MTQSDFGDLFILSEQEEKFAVKHSSVHEIIVQKQIRRSVALSGTKAHINLFSMGCACDCDDSL